MRIRGMVGVGGALLAAVLLAGPLVGAEPRAGADEDFASAGKPGQLDPLLLPAPTPKEIKAESAGVLEGGEPPNHGPPNKDETAAPLGGGYSSGGVGGE